MNFLTPDEKEKLKVRNQIALHFTHHSTRELSLSELTQIHNIIYGKHTDSRHQVID